MEQKEPSPHVPVKKGFPATVVKILSPNRLVINRGREDGIVLGRRFIVYSLGHEEIVDPETQEVLGHLEYFSGTGTVVHVQDKMSTIESDMTRTRRFTDATRADLSARGIYDAQPDTETVQMPFSNPSVGLKVKPA